MVPPVKKYHAVSTFNAQGLDLYGRDLITSFQMHWPHRVDLTIYSEGWDGEVTGATVLDLEQSSPWLHDFKYRNRKPRKNGFRYEAVRFAHKVAALCHLARNTDADVIIWLDGDIVTHADVSIDDLDGLAPHGNEWIAWLYRKAMYPECGFYMLNARHERHAEMIAAFERMYVEDRLFDLSQWHDSYVLQEVVKRAGVGWKNLSGAGGTTTHPLVNGPLGQWFDHKKGNRKKIGRTPKKDLRVKRKESYWT
jgi:hypothetical protein